MERTPQDGSSRDAEIIRLFFARNEKAVSMTEAAYGSYCRAIAVGILDSAEDAEECVNDTWLKAWNTIPPENPPSLKLYLGRLVRRLSIDRWRTLHRKKRNTEMTVVLDELDEIAPDGDVTDRLGTDLSDFLMTLNPDERNLFVGRYWYAYPLAVLAADHGLTENAVSLRLLRTREKLRTYLTERGYTL